jgi:hypothetical protein
MECAGYGGLDASLLPGGWDPGTKYLARKSMRRHASNFANEVGLSCSNGVQDIVDAEFVSYVCVPDVLVMHVFQSDANDLA